MNFPAIPRVNLGPWTKPELPEGLSFTFGMVLAGALIDRRGLRPVLRAEFLAPERDNPSGPWVRLSFSEPLHPEFDSTPERAEYELHRAFRRMIEHEIAEGFVRANGVRPFDPHKDDPPR